WIATNKGHRDGSYGTRLFDRLSEPAPCCIVGYADEGGSASSAAAQGQTKRQLPSMRDLVTRTGWASMHQPKTNLRPSNLVLDFDSHPPWPKPLIRPCPRRLRAPKC